MAVPFREQEGLAPEQVASLRLAESFYAMTQLDAWKELSEMMHSLVEEALERMQGNISPDPQQAYDLQLRWQQRQTIVRLIEAKVNSHLEEREQMLDELKENEPSGDNQ